MPAQAISSSNSASQRKTTLNTVYKVDVSLLVTEIPTPPDWMNEDGVKYWRYYCGLLIEGKVLSRMFLTSIENLCLCQMARAVMVDEIKKQGFMIDLPPVINKLGQLESKCIVNPLWRELEDLLIKMSKLLTDMGMTAYSAKVNNFDTTGNLTKPKDQGPPKIALPPQKPLD